MLGIHETGCKGKMANFLTGRICAATPGPEPQAKARMSLESEVSALGFQN
jgi:hypothetical protein